MPRRIPVHRGRCYLAVHFLDSARDPEHRLFDLKISLRRVYVAARNCPDLQFPEFSDPKIEVTGGPVFGPLSRGRLYEVLDYVLEGAAVALREFYETRVGLVIAEPFLRLCLRVEDLGFTLVPRAANECPVLRGGLAGGLVDLLNLGD